jgi:hypothetical protein
MSPLSIFSYLQIIQVFVLRYFRINDPYRLISIWLLLTLASLPLLIDLPSVTLQELKHMVMGEVIGNKLLYTEIIDKTGPLMATIDGFLNFAFGRSLFARHIIALIIILFQAAYFGILLVNNKAYNENSYVPSLVFGFLCFFSFDLLAVTPELLATTLLLLAMNNLFREIEFRVDRDSIVLNLGVFLGLASLFILSYTVFLVGTIFILIVFARATPRKILLVLFGYGLVHAILFTLYYVYEHTNDLWTHFYVASVNEFTVNLVGMKSILMLGLIPIIYFVFSLFMLTRQARFTKYQSQLFQTIFLWLGFAIIQFWLATERTPHSLYTFIPPAAYFISHYLLLIQRKWIAEIMLWVLIFGLLIVNFSSRYKALKEVDYSSLFPKPSPAGEGLANKRIMIVGNDLSLFQRNTMAGYFLDWELSRKYFEHPDYYENIIIINEAIESDLPDVIIDEAGLMGPVAERVPSLSLKYRRSGNMYWRR